MNQLILDVLHESQHAGYLGPGDVERHYEHALAYEGLYSSLLAAPPRRIADLGSGGGIPGLVLAHSVWPSASWWLVDASLRRVQFLRWAIQHLGLDGRVVAVHERAETAGREPDMRGSFDCVVARSFGTPPLVAECAAPLLATGGLLLVSEPPDDGAEQPAEQRWPADGIGQVGLEFVVRTAGPPRLAALRQIRLADERWPRRTGIPSKRPLY